MANPGQGLQALAEQLEAQRTAREDFIGPQGRAAAFVNPEGQVRLRLSGTRSKFGDDFGIRPHAHAQLATLLDIPKKYYDRTLAQRPELLATTLTNWFDQDASIDRMFRTVAGDVRGVLSPKYRALDGVEFADQILPKLIQLNAQIISAQLTETRLYIKAILPTLSDEIPAGVQLGQGHNAFDRGTIIAALTASTSDVGDGALRVEPGAFTTFCTNLATLLSQMKKFHVGRANNADDNTWEVLSDETRLADDKAFWLKVRDVTASAFDENIFRTQVAKLRLAASNPIKSDDVTAVVARVVEQLALPPAAESGILGFLAKGGDLTQWGLSSAITRVAAEATDLNYEDITALERAGGAVALMPKTEFAVIGEAVTA